VNLSAATGIAVREFVLKSPHGRADYLLFVHGQAVGVAEAKKEGETLTGVAWQTAKYVDGLPDALTPAVEGALPFAYQSTGVETRFTNVLDPDAKSRQVFWFHRPETLAGWIVEIRMHALAPTLRHRLRGLPALPNDGLWPAQGPNRSIAREIDRGYPESAMRGRRPASGSRQGENASTRRGAIARDSTNTQRRAFEDMVCATPSSAHLNPRSRWSGPTYAGAAPFQLGSRIVILLQSRSRDHAVLRGFARCSRRANGSGGFERCPVRPISIPSRCTVLAVSTGARARARAG
jgi:hypothetical protein